jgi:hypothetical protein
MPKGIQEGMKRLVVALLSLGLVFPQVGASSNVIPDEQYTQKHKDEDGWKSLYINEQAERHTASLIANPRLGDPSSEAFKRESYLCNSLEDAACLAAPYVYADTNLAPCLDANDRFCIESLYAIKPSGEKVEGVFKKAIVETGTAFYQPRPELNLPRPAMGGLWEIPGVTHGGGKTTYSVISNIVVSLDKGRNIPVTTQKFRINRFSTAIYAVNEVSGNYFPITANDSAKLGVKILGYGSWSGENVEPCAVAGVGVCLARQPLPLDHKLGVRVRIGAELPGWFHGRVFNPEISASTDSSGLQRVEISAFPVQVPVVGGWVQSSQLTDEVKNWITTDEHPFGGSGSWANKSIVDKPFAYNAEVNGNEALRILKMWLPILGDKAVAVPTMWRYRVLTGDEMGGTPKCISDAKEFSGLVTTNASVYGAGAPDFKKEDGVLDYKVMAPHFTPKNEEFLGTYDLAIKKSLTKCLYGFTDAPISASISIFGEDGSKKVATTVVGEKEGWLYLSAKGFTYSAPVVQVKMVQERPTVAVVPSPTPTPNPTNTPLVTTKLMKKSVLCIKGARTKMLVGAKAKCPKGYKKA